MKPSKRRIEHGFHCKREKRKLPTMMNSITIRSLSRLVTRQTIVPRGVVGPSSSSVRLYHDNIVEHYENPRNVGSLDKTDSSVGTVRDTI